MWEEPLCLSSPSFYALVVSKEARVVDFWDDIGGIRHWTLHFTRHFNNELDIINTFLFRLRGYLVKMGDSDSLF